MDENIKEEIKSYLEVALSCVDIGDAEAIVSLCQNIITTIHNSEVANGSNS